MDLEGLPQNKKSRK